VPLFVNAIVPSVIVPMSFVFVVCVVPVKKRLHVPDVVGFPDAADVNQLDVPDQLPVPAPPVHVAFPLSGTANDGLTPTQKA